MCANGVFVKIKTCLFCVSLRVLICAAKKGLLQKCVAKLGVFIENACNLVQKCIFCEIGRVDMLVEKNSKQ